MARAAACGFSCLLPSRNPASPSAHPSCGPGPNPFGPLGTPLVDIEGAGETIDNLIDALMQAELRLPKVLVLPLVRLNGPFVRMIRTIAMTRNLPVATAERDRRPLLENGPDADSFLHNRLSSDERALLKAKWSDLEAMGEVTYDVARQARDVRMRMEEFLALEAHGASNRKRNALVTDRYRTAFAREAINNLAEIDLRAYSYAEPER